MSTLTKILIVLLTVASMLLCGIVISYVTSADNYKQKFDSLKSDRDSLNQKVKARDKQVNELVAKNKQLEEKLKAQIASLNEKLSDTENKLNTTEREKSLLLEKVNNWTTITRDFQKTNDKQGLLLKNTLGELDKVQAEQIKERKQLKETTAVLVVKMEIIETLETEKNRLLEEKTELQNRLNTHLQPFGKQAPTPTPVTPARDVVRIPTARARDIGLKGLVSDVDLKNSVAEISLGSADGIREGMRFHVTRGEEFLCDILIISVDSEKSVGVLELIQQSPKVGDNVSTNL